MKRTKQFLATLLTLLMLVSVVPLGAMNVSAASYTKEQASALRSKIVQYMYEMGTVKWIAGKQFNDGGFTGSFYEGKTYYGIPYQNSGKVNNASLGKFKDLLKKNDNKIYEIPGHNDCSTAIALAYKAYISDFPFTTSSPMYFRPGTNNFITVGSYQLKWEKGDTAKTCGERTCSKNGKNTMFSSYSAMQSGDVLIGGSGHIMLVVSVDTAKKTVKVTHQMGYYAKYDPSTDTSVAIDEKKVGGQAKAREQKNTTWGINQTKSFQTIFDGNYFPARYKPLDTGSAPVSDDPTVTLRDTSHIETNAATVHLTAWNPGNKLITARGVQVKKKGESSWAKTYSEDLSKKTYNKDTEITGYFDIGSGKEVNYALSAGTTYEYRCFVTSGGKNYYSEVSTFKTLQASTPTVTLRSPSHIEKNAATVHLTAKNPSKLLITARGVQVKKKGESSWAKTYSEDLSKKTYNKDTEITGYFDIGSGKEVNYALSAGTTYEYRCFVTSGGTNYYSSTSTFSTLPPDADPTFSKVYASDITDTNATINAEFGSLTSIKSTGFYFGTNKDSLKKITKNLDGKADSAGKVKKIYFGMNKWYGKLTPGTTYYYKIFYVNNSGKECASNIYSFKTTGTLTYNFTVKYDANGGTGTMANQNAKSGQPLTLTKNAFEKKGYTFAGWNVKRASDSKWFVADQGWKTASDITKNKWTKKVYEDGHTCSFDSSWSNGAKADETFTFVAVWKDCEHVWDGGVVTKEPTTKATGVMTYTCEKCGKTKTEKIPVISAYQMKFNANGGKGTMASFLAEEDEAFLLPENQFTKVGYTFGGWTVKRGSDSKWYTTDGDWNTAKVIKADELEKEIFESETEYTFTEDWINGSKNSDTYTFYAVWVACEHEWDEGEVTKEPTTSATGVMTYTCEICGKTKTAKIPKISTYSIKFNANGGKGTVAGMKVEKDGSFTLPENGFTKDGYLFIGWSVKRASDSKWLVEDDGWQTAKEIKANSYEKILFEEDSDLALDEDWINGSKETDTYTFYAMWEKDV